MNDDNWKEEYKRWKAHLLQPYQIKLLEEGAKSNNQTLILSDMWLEWKDLAAKRKINEISGGTGIEDPWDESIVTCKKKNIEIDDQLLNFVDSIQTENIESH